MPRLDPSTIKPSQIYGKQEVENNLTMGERIRKRFKPTDTVKVHNLTNTTIEWQWLEESDETYGIEDETNIKIVERKDPGLWVLGPGEQDILPGSCAYVMIEALFKQISVMKTGIIIRPLDESEIKNFGFDDPAAQEQMIDLIFLGKITPQMMQQAAAESLGSFKPQITEKLAALPTRREEYDKRAGRTPGGPAAITTPPAINIEQHEDLADLKDENPFKDEADDSGEDEADDSREQPKPAAAGQSGSGNSKSKKS